MRSYPLTVYAQLDRIVTALERPLGPRFAAALVGLFGLGLACLVVRLGSEPVGSGALRVAVARSGLDPQEQPGSFRR
jgi:hypothetical protein